MKQTFVKIVSKKLIVMAGIMATFTFASFNQAKAGSIIKADPSQPSIQYVGTTDSGILFNVKFDNTTGSKFDLIIQNDDGIVLYEHQYNDKNFNQNIVLIKEPGDAKLSFIVKGASTNLKESFNISTISKVIEDVTVTKAN
ncbi:MAG: hypothetical protein ACR2FN_03575 [Chitinophagaceae bacterium]